MVDRRDFLSYTLAAASAAVLPAARAQGEAAANGPDARDRVFITNEDSNTLVVIDPRRNVVDTTINLTSFDEDPRPPFRYVTAGVAPTHAAMIHKPLYHGCIDAHGAVPSPDGRMLATVGRGSSNVYFIDTVARRLLGNTPNPAAGADTNAERIGSGILVGREPHEPTFTRDGRELWVTVRGEDRICIIDMQQNVPLRYVETLNGPAQVWFSADGALAFVADLGPLYLVGVGLVAVLLVYEQSLVSADDLSQVKRAFDLNGYVGILYFVSTAVAVYVR